VPSKSWLKGKFKQYKLDLPSSYRHPDHASIIRTPEFCIQNALYSIRKSPTFNKQRTLHSVFKMLHSAWSKPLISCFQNTLDSIRKEPTGWRTPIGCRSFSEKEPLIIGLFCGKWPTKIRHPMGLRYSGTLNVCKGHIPSHQKGALLIEYRFLLTTIWFWWRFAYSPTLNRGYIPA